MTDNRSIEVTLDAVIIAVTEETPRLLTVGDALPSGKLDTEGDLTLQAAMRRVVAEQTGLTVGYVEQLYTFGDRDRDPTSLRVTRHVSIAYLALIEEVRPTAAASWLNLYQLFPWEDRRGDTSYLDSYLRPRLNKWIGAGKDRATRKERVAITFGLDDAPWDGVKVLERYELLFEIGAVAESFRERGSAVPGDLPPSSALSHDSRRIAASALGRLRGKVTYRPVIFELVPDTFTLTTLQRTMEALAGARLHKQNFRRLVERGGLVEGTGRFAPATGGRPAELFRFRRAVLLERPRPGLGHPSRG